jgi:hypothetical protein
MTNNGNTGVASPEPSQRAAGSKPKNWRTMRKKNTNFTVRGATTYMKVISKGEEILTAVDAN